MKNVIYIVTFLFLLIPISNVWACGNSSNQTSTEQTHCKTEQSDSEKKSCCDSHDDNQENDCSGKCNDANCHCPVSVNTPIPASYYEFKALVSITQGKSKWAFIQNAPKPIYLSIWQPPKIS